MNSMQRYILLILMLITVQGCLDFGDDIENSNPTADQVSACRKIMYINSSANITPLGYKLIGSGIDDSVWFKFKTDVADLSQVFDTNIVDINKFVNDFVIGDLKGVKWWDVQGKKLFGGQVPLPNVKFMNVGAQKTASGFIIYIRWYET